MKIAPFIKPIKLQGGTFYTCSSAAEDLQLTVSNSKNKFRFSNYSLLKLPMLKRFRYSNEDIANGGINKPNYIQLDSPIAAYKFYREQQDAVDNNMTFAESFENYFYNLETMITAQDTYQIDARRTVSERVFFKWLKEIGAIRFRQANANELAVNVGPGTAYGARYIEEDNTFDIEGNFIYERVVKYIGNINVINSIKNPSNSYTEVYIHIPTSHGSTKDVLFDAIADENYTADMIFKNLPTDPLNDGIIYGRDYNDTNPAGLRINAHFDSLGSFTDVLAKCWYFDETAGEFVDNTNENFKWWFPVPDDNTYHLEPASFNNAQNDIFAIGENPNDETEFNNIKFIRNRLDGISLEFNPNVYNKIAGNPDITCFGEYNASGYADTFSFNTVLVYYDVYNEDNPDDYTTNLFGILFLDNVDTIPGEGGEIKSITKYKPNTVLQQNGNSYAFKLNIKYDVTAQDPAVEVSINDYNTYSLQLYLDALTEMRRSNTLLMEHIATYQDTQKQLAELKSIIYNATTYEALQEQLNSLQKQFNDAGEVFLNNQNIVNLINKNYEEITNIYKNYTSIEMAYNLDAIKQGLGIEIGRSTGTYATINNINQSFNINDSSILSLESNFTMLPDVYKYYYPVVPFDNYIRITDGSYGNPFVVDRDIQLYLDDSNVEWKKGQKVRLSFANGLNLDNPNGTFYLHIYSDALNKLSNENPYIEIALITYDQFTIKNGKPLIELICIDPATFTFVVDIF